MTDEAPNLVIEDDKVQHYVANGALNVYSPKYGTMHVTRVNDAFSLKHAHGMLPPGFFFETISSGFSVAEALARTGFAKDAALEKFGERVEDWMP